jgi:hypothetical protein
MGGRLDDKLKARPPHFRDRARIGIRTRESKIRQTMSKKSEHSARVRKQRTVQPPRVQEKANSSDLSDVKPAEAPRVVLRTPLPKWLVRTLQVMAPLAALSCLCGIVSAIVPPSVPVPSPLMASIVPPVEIVNQSFLPIYKIDYSCEFASIQDQSGFSVPAGAPVPDAVKTKSILHRNEKMPVECVGGMDVSGLRIKSTEFRVTISYFHVGWPFRRHTEYRVRSEFDTHGNFLHWTVE